MSFPSYATWLTLVSAHVERRAGVTLEDIPEGGPMPFDWPDFEMEWEVGTKANEVAEHILWCAGFPGAEPVL